MLSTGYHCRRVQCLLVLSVSVVSCASFLRLKEGEAFEVRTFHINVDQCSPWMKAEGPVHLHTVLFAPQIQIQTSGSKGGGLHCFMYNSTYIITHCIYITLNHLPTCHAIRPSLPPFYALLSDSHLVRDTQIHRL